MNIDWAVAISVFLLFFVWSFFFYTNIYTMDQDITSSLESISDSVLENLTVKVHTMNVKVYSQSDQTDIIMSTEYIWPFGKNTTKVYLDSEEKECIISNDMIFWQSDLSRGYNYFDVKYSEQDSNMSCSGNFSQPAQDNFFMYSAEEVEQISLARLNQMLSSDYQEFKSGLGITKDFNVSTETYSGNKTSYGIPPPKASNVYSKKVLRVLEETQEQITIHFLTW